MFIASHNKTIKLHLLYKNDCINKPEILLCFSLFETFFPRINPVMFCEWKDGRICPDYLKEIDTKYLALSLEALNINQFAKTGGQPSVSQNTVYELKIPLPSLATQKQIVEKIESERALVESSKRLIAIYEQKMKDATAKLWN